jgi:hypothetical protein
VSGLTVAAKSLRNQRADVVGLQEVCGHALHTIVNKAAKPRTRKEEPEGKAKEISYASTYRRACGQDCGGGSFGNAVLARTGYQLQGDGAFRLPHISDYDISPVDD